MKPLLFLGLGIGLIIGFVFGMIAERTNEASPTGINTSLPATITSAITADINGDDADDFIFHDEANVMIAISGEDGKFIVATVIGTAYDEMADNLEIILIAEGEVSSIPVDEENESIAELACDIIRPQQ